MSILLYLCIPGLPSYIKLSERAGAVPRKGDRIRVDAGCLACARSREMLETVPAFHCFERNAETERMSVARFLEECVMVVESREWSYEDGLTCCLLNVSVEW